MIDYRVGDKVRMKVGDGGWIFCDTFKEGQEAVIVEIIGTHYEILVRDDVYQSCGYDDIELIRPVVTLDDSLFEVI